MILNANALYIPLANGTVQTCVTSPPYFGLRDYGTAQWGGGDPECDHVAGLSRQDSNRDTPGGRGGSFRADTVQYKSICGKCGAVRIDSQIGLEPTPEAYVEKLVAVFREVKRVLRDDGTLWLNLGDSYGHGTSAGRQKSRTSNKISDEQHEAQGGRHGGEAKQLLGIPWRVAFALQADGWYLRSEIIWHKSNAMPESVTDRPTKSHEQIFLLSKFARYYYDAEAIKEQSIQGDEIIRDRKDDKVNNTPGRTPNGALSRNNYETRNKRSVWTVATQPYAAAHFATYPPKLIEPCILAGSREDDIVLDPFSGSGTTGQVAIQYRRRYVGLELNMDYIGLSRERTTTDVMLPMFSGVTS